MTITESWKLSFRNEILADIQHSLHGLMPETLLRSKETGLSWRVKSRTIFIQVENQKRFNGEKETWQRFTFMQPIDENYERFRREILEKEEKGIYQYSIEPVGHNTKPAPGEILEIV